ncbi:hypothetical protein INS49_015192 [Diaporthe citri]|uniref:uncharacterized protein n=1 Tax=Diaporthe citri TaxID=83186 RepID=UPI001C81D8CF|nr:uncharacterized protein INS49_015192 [Diaporthe citri]KAG6357314.1 hypothetical protein INS49_015192 [Diaporthe citri]
MQPIENPAAASWGLNLSEKDFAALKRGCRIRDMDDRWAFVYMTDQELLDELSAEKKATTDEVLTDDQLLDELEMEEPWMEEERTEKAAPARVVTEEDMAQGGYISIRRTWSNIELYRLVLTVQPSEGGISRKIEAITWEQREDHLISGEQAKMDVVLLCRSHLECDLAAAPDNDALQFSGLL